MSPFSFVLTEVSFQGRKVSELSPADFVILISISFTKTGVGSFTVPEFTAPGTSVQEIEANRGSNPSDLTATVYVLPFINSISEIID